MDEDVKGDEMAEEGDGRPRGDVGGEDSTTIALTAVTLLVGIKGETRRQLRLTTHRCSPPPSSSCSMSSGVVSFGKLIRRRRLVTPKGEPMSFEKFTQPTVMAEFGGG